MFAGCFQEFHGCLKDVSRMFKGHLNEISSGIKNVSSMFQGSFKEGVHQFYKFVLKCKVRYTDTAVICDFPQIC